MKTFKLFIKVFALTFVILTVITAAGFIYTLENTMVDKGNQDEIMPEDEEGQRIYDKQQALTEENLTIAILGGDKVGLIDTIMVVNYNEVTDKIDVISVPRDTKIDLLEQQKDIIEERHNYRPEHLKLTELGGNMGSDNLKQGVLYELGRILEIEIDHYVTVNWNAFKLIVDELGGVEIDVPSYGSKFGLSPGVQTINGEEALDLCRERKSTPEGDYSRIKMQQEVLKACLKELKSMNATNITGLVNIAYNHVRTDLSSFDIIGYIPVISKINLDEMEVYTIQGYEELINGKSYQILDEESRLEIINKVYGDYRDEDEEDKEDITSHSNEEVNSTQ